MELLAQVETNGGPGRWIVTPRKGTRFVGPVQRRQARARERRRKVLAFLLESIGLTFLIGLVPPLRVIWVVSGVLIGLLAVYVWLLLSLRARAPQSVGERAAAAQAPDAGSRVVATAQRYVAEGRSTRARPTFNGLGSMGEGDRVHVGVRPKNEIGGARA